MYNVKSKLSYSNEFSIKILDCMNTYGLCPPGKPGVLLILLRKPMNVTFQYLHVLLCFRTIHYVLLCMFYQIYYCVHNNVFMYLYTRK